MTEQSAKQYEQRNLKTNEFVSFDETCHPPSRESNPTSHPPSRERSTPTRERNTTSQESNRSSRESTNPPSREGRRGRTQSIYSQHQSIKPLNMQSIIEAQKRISLNPAYMQMCKKLDKNALHEKLNDKVKLTKACHRPVTVPLVKIIGKIPDYVDVSELLGLRREFTELQKDYHNIMEARRYNVHRRHVELMEIDKITSNRLRKRFVQTLKAYGISANVISDVLAEFK